MGGINRREASLPEATRRPVLNCRLFGKGDLRKRGRSCTWQSEEGGGGVQGHHQTCMFSFVKKTEHTKDGMNFCKVHTQPGDTSDIRKSRQIAADVRTELFLKRKVSRYA